MKKILLFISILMLSPSSLAESLKNSAGLANGDLKLINDIYAAILEKYVDEIKGADLLDACLSGMLSKAGPEARILNVGEFRNKDALDKRSGVGLELNIVNGEVRVINPIEGAPAFLAGVRAGDALVKINGIPVRGKSLNEIVSILRGPPGSKVTLSMLRPGKNALLDIDVFRKEIQVQTTALKLLPGDVVYIQVARLGERTPFELAHKLIEASSLRKIRGIILDIRNNKGGLLNSAVELVSIFLPQGALIVTTHGRDSVEGYAYRARDNKFAKFTGGFDRDLKSIPMVVLINDRSAAGAEIVASSMQDNNRAIVVGYPSVGVSTIETIISISDDSKALSLTTERWKRPKFLTMGTAGVIPDFVMPEIKEPNDVSTSSSDLFLLKAQSLLH